MGRFNRKIEYLGGLRGNDNSDSCCTLSKRLQTSYEMKELDFVCVLFVMSLFLECAMWISITQERAGFA